MTGGSPPHEIPVRPVSASPLRLQPLRPDAFAPFGQVVALGDLPLKPVNEGRGTRLDLPEARPSDARAGRPATALYRLAPSPLPLQVSLLERHVLTEQVFWPLSAGRFVVVVCPSRAGGSPRVQDLVAFMAEPGQALVYAAGTWHLPLAVLEQEAVFAMRMWESGLPLDCEEHVLARPVTVVA